MDHLAQDLTVALEESESCGTINIINGTKWGMRRRTRSAGNLHLFFNKPGDNHTDESSSSNSEMRADKHHNKFVSLHQSDSDDMSISIAVVRALNSVSHSLESDSVNEHSPARPSLRRKRKLKRMSIDEAPVPPCGKRKRSQRLDICDGGRSIRHPTKIKPLHPSVVDKIEKFCQPPVAGDETNKMETQSIDENCEVASESSISWSGGEGHEGDDELTDWAPSMENSSIMDQSWYDIDPREIRAGCRRLREERPGFSISTGANEKVAKFLQDSTKSELRIYGAERDKLAQLANLYSLDMWFDGPNHTLLKKTNKTPAMQPPQRHHSGLNAIHKKIRTQRHIIS